MTSFNAATAGSALKKKENSSRQELLHLNIWHNECWICLESGHTSLQIMRYLQGYTNS
jgi:hypothetical protein